MSQPILVVDDDPSIRDTVADALGDEGYDVRTANNGAEALSALEVGLPALVLLDMRMPVLDGWGFARALVERGISVPIVVMTAAQEARRWGAEINAAWVLPKPFDLLELLETVERLVQAPE
jgi:DNA-binding response OmpR family regulator